MTVLFSPRAIWFKVAGGRRQKLSADRVRETAANGGWQRTEESPALGHPGKAALEHGDARNLAEQASHGKCQQGPVAGQIGAQQNARESGGGRVEEGLNVSWPHMEDAELVARDGRRRERGLEAILVGGDSEMADVPTGGDACLGQMRRQPLLQLLGGS